MTDYPPFTCNKDAHEILCYCQSITAQQLMGEGLSSEYFMCSFLPADLAGW